MKKTLIICFAIGLATLVSCQETSQSFLAKWQRAKTAPTLAKIAEKELGLIYFQYQGAKHYGLNIPDKTWSIELQTISAKGKIGEAIYLLGGANYAKEVDRPAWLSPSTASKKEATGIRVRVIDQTTMSLGRVEFVLTLTKAGPGKPPGS